MKTILFIHQSAEMYGSDKTLLLLVSNCNKNKIKPIVILPNNGPLKTALEKHQIEVVIAPVLKLYRKMFSPKNLITFFTDFIQGIKTINTIRKKYQITAIYSNTLAVLLGFFYSIFYSIKHVWHVHEIIETPTIFKKSFRFLLAQKNNTVLIYNSKATQKFWNINNKNNTVVWNGISPFSSITEVEKNKIRQQLFQSKNENDVLLALVGRISSWKGQQILLEAFKEIVKTMPFVKLIYIGSPPPNQNCFLEELEQKIEDYKLQKKVRIIPFQNQIEKIWQSIDIAIIPSTNPEPFGLVAIEAMMAKKPIIASNHGGLTEIVEHTISGYLVEPNNITALTEAIKKMSNNKTLQQSMGKKGYERAIAHFSVKSYVNAIETLLLKI